MTRTTHCNTGHTTQQNTSHTVSLRLLFFLLLNTTQVHNPTQHNTSCNAPRNTGSWWPTARSPTPASHGACRPRLWRASARGCGRRLATASQTGTGGCAARWGAWCRRVCIRGTLMLTSGVCTRSYAWCSVVRVRAAGEAAGVAAYASPVQPPPEPVSIEPVSPESSRCILLTAPNHTGAWWRRAGPAVPPNAPPQPRWWWLPGGCWRRWRWACTRRWWQAARPSRWEAAEAGVQAGVAACRSGCDRSRQHCQGISRAAGLHVPGMWCSPASPGVAWRRMGRGRQIPRVPTHTHCLRVHVFGSQMHARLRLGNVGRKTTKYVSC